MKWRISREKTEDSGMMKEICLDATFAQIPYKFDGLDAPLDGHLHQNEWWFHKVLYLYLFRTVYVTL